MKDLKHLIYFENLLQEANNELVKQAKKDGKKILGYTCYSSESSELHVPGYGDLLHVWSYLSLWPQPAGAGTGGRL